MVNQDNNTFIAKKPVSGRWSPITPIQPQRETRFKISRDRLAETKSSRSRVPETKISRIVGRVPETKSSRIFDRVAEVKSNRIYNDRVAETNSLDGFLFSDSEASPKFRRFDLNMRVANNKVHVSKPLMKNKSIKKLPKQATFISIIGENNIRPEIKHSKNSRPLESEFEIIYSKKSSSTVSPPQFKSKQLSARNPLIIFQGHSNVRVFKANNISNSEHNPNKSGLTIVAPKIDNTSTQESIAPKFPKIDLILEDLILEDLILDKQNFTSISNDTQLNFEDEIFLEVVNNTNLLGSVGANDTNLPDISKPLTSFGSTIKGWLSMLTGDSSNNDQDSLHNLTMNTNHSMTHDKTNNTLNH